MRWSLSFSSNLGFPRFPSRIIWRYLTWSRIGYSSSYSPKNQEGLHNSCSHSYSAPGMTSSQDNPLAKHTQSDGISAICYLSIISQSLVLTLVWTSPVFSPILPAFHGDTFPEFFCPFFWERQVARQWVPMPRSWGSCGYWLVDFRWWDTTATLSDPQRN